MQGRALAQAQGIEVEPFTSGPALSVLAQLRAGMEEDLLPDAFEAISDLFVERGEMWLYSEDIAGSPLNLDLGRLHFEDEHRLPVRAGRPRLHHTAKERTDPERRGDST